MSRTRLHLQRVMATLASFVLAVVVLGTSTASYATPPSTHVQQEQVSATGVKVYLPYMARYQIAGIPDRAFTETFDGQPNAPLQWKSTNWDITVHRRAIGNTFEEPMQADHGADCAGPPAKHTIQRFDEAVYQCKSHLMTAIFAHDYGMIYLTPNRMVDFSKGEAVIRWEMSTLRTSLRDWVDLWVTPYEDNLQIPLNDYLPDGNGEPRRSVQIKMDEFNDQSIFKALIYKDFQANEAKGNWYTGYNSFLTPDPARRDIFELRISRTHIKFGMPAYNFYWIDNDIQDLGWSRGVVQFGHHSYNPLKLCTTPCSPDTWHWDNMTIAPSVPFTIIRGTPSIISTDTVSTPVLLDKPAPAQANLRFTAANETIEVSFDNGSSWIPAVRQQQKKQDMTRFQNYWMPIPAGTTSVKFRRTGTPFSGLGTSDWQVRDVSVWAPPSS